MSVYVKGLLAVVVVIVGLGFYYSMNKDRLTFQTTPKQYSLLDKMEKEGVPDFELPRTDGSKFSLSEVRGKVVIVNFWASWCNPCVQEFPSFIELIKRFNGEVVLVAISTDEVREDMDIFLKAFGLPKTNIHMLWDKDRAIADRYGVGKIPESFLVARDGKLLRKVAGIDNWATPEAIAFFENLTRK